MQILHPASNLGLNHHGNRCRMCRYFVLLLILAVSITEIRGECSPSPTACGPGCYYTGETSTCGFACIARVCIPVGAGHYSADNDNGRYACPRATFYNITEAEVCQPCPIDTYNDAQGQAVCKPCPPGTHTNGQIGQDTIMDCSPLPTSMPTSSPSRSPITASPHPSTRPSSFPSRSRPSFEPSHMALTSTPSVDPTSVMDSTSPRPSSTPSADANSSYQPSMEPSSEFASLSCYSVSNQNKYYFKSGRCKNCPSASSSILLSIALLAIFIGLVIAYRQMPSPTPALYYIRLDYLQLLSFLGTDTPFTWPTTVDSTLSALAVFNFDLDAILPLECLLSSSHETKELAIVCLPLIVLVIGIIISLIFRRRPFVNRFAGIAFGCVYFAYLQLASSSFQAMVGSAGAGSGRASSIIGAITFKIYGISFPLFVARSLFRQQARYGIKSIQSMAKQGGRGDESTNAILHRYWLLCGPFRSSRWYWSVVVLARKLWLVCATFLWRGRRPLVLGCVLTVLFVLSGVVNFLVKPYVELIEEIAGRKGNAREDETGNGTIQKITARRNVDLILHSSLCLVVAIGAVSTGLLKDGEPSWKVSIALSFGALVVILSSICLLIFSAWIEISRAKQLLPDIDGSRWNATDASYESSLVRLSNSVGSRFSFGRKRGSQVVPSRDSSSSRSGCNDGGPSSEEDDY